MIHNTKKT